MHHVSLSISPQGDGAQGNVQFASNYQRAIDGLRRETGPVLRGYVRTTEPDNDDLIRLRVYRDGSQPVDLFFTANDLYLHAWATYNDGDDPEQGRLFEFGDRHIGPLLGWNHRHVVHTGLPGGYIGLERTVAYGRDDDSNNPNRHNIEYGRPSLWRAFSDLDNADGRYRINRLGAPDPVAGAPTRNELARSLITVITATSEAVRFRPIASDIRNAVHYNRPTTMNQQNLDLIQDWDLVSQWMLNVTHDPNAQPSEHIDSEIRRHLHSFQDGQGYLAVVHKKSSPK
ncbi:ribosome-inactivating family protein [Streptomyces sp. PSAA01]|uniref:ribosome-inactivating family protein n=1 Tax=Streptomyces sp. PSAA01 TaxID=2912762 RepID=UPI001F486ABA|nr:ribosome-inactivating family protein [Streptomyces sp. PSAA01]MCG0290346.1 ribosome-inactivating family protein [Streptomyces sp. PSAA01]